MPLRQEEELDVEGPAFDVHIGEQKGGRLAREHLEAALCVADPANAEERDEVMEAPHQEIAEPVPLSHETGEAHVSYCVYECV